MDRKEIKEEAKAKLKGNIWNILWPMLIIIAIESILSNIFGGTININLSDIESLQSIKVPSSTYVNSGIVTILTGILGAGYLKYILNFVRTGKFETNTIINIIKEKWLNILIAEILTSIIITVGFVFFVIPGIILSLAYTMVTYLVIETDVDGNDALKESREMMKGHKFEYFIFILSFIGWMILVPFTLGLLLIWLVPYMIVAEAIYFDKLKKLNK